MHEPFEHVEARALEIAQLKLANAQLQQSINAVVEAIKDEPEAKQPVQPGPAAVASVVAGVVARLKRSIMLASKKAETNGEKPHPDKGQPFERLLKEEQE